MYRDVQIKLDDLKHCQHFAPNPLDLVDLKLSALPKVALTQDIVIVSAQLVFLLRIKVFLSYFLAPQRSGFLSVVTKLEDCILLTFQIKRYYRDLLEIWNKLPAAPPYKYMW
jgi:hypothetical protein